MKQTYFSPVEKQLTCPESSSSAYGLCRLSPEEEKTRKETSIENQKAYIIEYCKRTNVLLHGFFIEKDTHSWDFDRPAISELIAMAIENKITMVLAKNYSRFARNVILQEEIIGTLNDEGIRVISIMEESMEKEEFPRQVTAAANASLISKLRKDTWNGVKRRLEAGLPVSRAPFGYRRDGDIDSKTFKQWYIWKPESDKVKKIFEQKNYKELGMDYKEIIKKLRITKDIYYNILKSKEIYEGWLLYEKKVKDFRNRFKKAIPIKVIGIHECILKSTRPELEKEELISHNKKIIEKNER